MPNPPRPDPDAPAQAPASAEPQPQGGRVEGVGPGALIICPRPDPRRLAARLAQLRAQGARGVLSLLEPEEAADLGLAQEAQACAAAGLSFRSFPIVDFGLPPLRPFRALVDEIEDQIRAGQGLAVHCRAGIGRSGMLVSCVAARFLGEDQAVAAVAAARGRPIPDTEDQRAFIARLHALGRG